MNSFILIVMMHVGIMGNGNSNALTSVAGFETLAACEGAGRAIAAAASGTVKEIKYVCASTRY